MINDAQIHEKQELRLIGMLLREALIKNNYDLVKQFLIEWGKAKETTAEIKAKTPDGSILVHYVRETPAEYPLRLA